MRATTLAVTAILAVSCGNRWPEEVGRNFTRSCIVSTRAKVQDVSDAAVIRYCDCALRRMEVRYTVEELRTMEALALGRGGASEEQTKIVADCTSELLRAAKSAPPNPAAP